MQSLCIESKLINSLGSRGRLLSDKEQESLVCKAHKPTLIIGSLLPSLIIIPSLLGNEVEFRTYDD